MNTTKRLLIELMRKGEATREYLSETLEVARSTLTYVVANLLNDDVVFVQKQRVGRGRPREIIRINPSAWRVLGVKVGREEVIGLLMNANFDVIEIDKRVVTHDMRNRIGYEKLIRDVLDDLMSDSVVAVGFSISGVLEGDVVVESPMLKIEGLRPTELIGNRGGITVMVLNDVEALAMYEHVVHGGDRFLVINYGTGIGASFYDGGLVRSNGRTIFQIGHVIIDPNGEECYCGQMGCLETVASDYANLKRFTGEDFRMVDFVEFEHERFDKALNEMRSMAKRGELLEVYKPSLDVLTFVVGNLMRVLEPEKIVFYGEGIAKWMVDYISNKLTHMYKISTEILCRESELDAFEKGSAFMATLEFIESNF